MRHPESPMMLGLGLKELKERDAFRGAHYGSRLMAAISLLLCADPLLVN